MSRGDRRENVFLDDVDRQDVFKALAETCQKTGFEVPAYCLMPDHFHLVVETPDANRVAGMAWWLSQRKKAPGQLDLAARLRRETILPLKWIAARVHLGTSKSANGKLHARMRAQTQPTAESSIVSVETKEPVA